jgi:CRP/FNR family transcriptional regulator, transcriptional activator FtrB
MRPAEHDLVRSLRLFKAVSPEQFEVLISAAFLQRFPQGVTLINEGDLPDFLHVVVEGSVELFAKHGRHETTLDIMQPVTTFILAAVIRDEVYLKSARTLTPAQVLMIPAQTVRDVFDRDAGFARAIVDELATRYRVVVRSLKNEKLRTSAERLANWILRQDARQGERGVVELDIDKRTLASRLGMTPENLSRNLAQLAGYGVRNMGHSFVVENRTALARFAHPNPLIDE